MDMSSWIYWKLLNLILYVLSVSWSECQEADIAIFAISALTDMIIIAHGLITVLAEGIISTSLVILYSLLYLLL